MVHNLEEVRLLEVADGLEHPLLLVRVLAQHRVQVPLPQREQLAVVARAKRRGVPRLEKQPCVCVCVSLSVTVTSLISLNNNNGLVTTSRHLSGTVTRHVNIGY